MPDRLTAGQALKPDQSITSGNGAFQLILQADGNLVLYATNTHKSLFASNTAGDFAIGQAIMQGDGNFVLYDNSGKSLWASNTATTDTHKTTIDPYVVVQDDGNLVIYATTNFWATNTNT